MVDGVCSLQFIFIHELHRWRSNGILPCSDHCKSNFGNVLPNFLSNLHRKRAAILSCFVMWLCVHVIFLPGLVVDALYYRSEPLEIYGCDIKRTSQQQKNWVITITNVFFDLPLVLILCAYTILWHKLRIQRVGISAGDNVQATRQRKKHMKGSLF